MNYSFLTSPARLVIWMGVAVSLLVAAPRAVAEIRCATVDLEMLLSQYHKAQKDSESLLEKRKEYMQQQVKLHHKRKKLENPIKALIVKIRAETQPSEQKDALIRDYEKLIGEYRSLSQDIKDLESGHVKTIKEQLKAATHRSLDEIQLAIHEFAREKGYHWIIDTSGNSNTKISPLIYAKDAPDVTEEILSVINKDAPEKNKEKAD
ncbi:MAG: OmpH family outer membrane protein [Verrucomicrobiae bacterium]|nr:OmpH family outer membrane protein [Verrucomicrobiae bacterium]NNJ87481.1 OmpH family outer membrane protein [Akkermansiaceae bacterium]